MAEEVKFGRAGKKGITGRHGAKSPRSTNGRGAADTVSPMPLIVDHWGIVEGRVAIKERVLSGAIGKGRQIPIFQASGGGVNHRDRSRPPTASSPGEGKILTAGGFRTATSISSLFTVPQQRQIRGTLLMSGVTSMLVGAAPPGPSPTARFATTCTGPGPLATLWRGLEQSFDCGFRSNLGNFRAKGQSMFRGPASLVERMFFAQGAGACALSSWHEDCGGTTPGAIDNFSFRVADD